MGAKRKKIKHHEETRGSRGIVPPFFTSALDGGELHDPAALPPGKSPLVHIGYEVGWASEPVWTMWGKLLLCQEIVPGPSSP
jgi:hypothetical protein